MKKIIKRKQKALVRRTYHTTQEVNKALVEYANEHERPAAWVINYALKKLFGMVEQDASK